MPIQLEPAEPGTIIDRNFQVLQALVPDTGGRSIGIRYGTQVLTWPGGSPFTNTPVVAHGLDRTPVAVTATGSAVSNVVLCYTGVPGSTSFVLSGWCPNASPAAGSHETVSWIAIG